MAGDCAFLLLVTVLTSTHLLLASAAASPGALGVLPFSLWLCAHLRLGQGFSSSSCLPFALLWALGILVPVASLLHLGFLPSRWGHPLRGRGLFVLDRNEGLVSPFGSGALDSSWLALQPLSAGFCAPCSSGSVARWSSLCP